MKPGPPSAVRWFKGYAVLAFLGSLGLVALGVSFLVVPEVFLDGEDLIAGEREEVLRAGIVYTVLGSILAAAYGLGCFTPQRPWSWVYHLVLIALGMTSCVCLPFLVVLLIGWIRPEVRAWYRADDVAPDVVIGP